MKSDRPHSAAVAARFGFAGLLLLMLTGCSFEGIVEFFHLDALVSLFPAGEIADKQRYLMIFTFVTLMFVLIPVVTFSLWFFYRYRRGNAQSRYDSEWDSSHLLELFLWAGPVVIILVLGTLTWFSTFALDPYKDIESDNPEIKVQAIAMDWKWLFIYPDYDIAVVNELAMPVDYPVEFDLTSATVMNAFMIPRLGSQIMAMSGMRTRLHLIANEPGTFFGKNYQYSGDGFAGMTFETLAVDIEEFERWVAEVRSSGQPLDLDAYRELVEPSRDVKPIYYSSVPEGLFGYVMHRFKMADGKVPPDAVPSDLTAEEVAQHGHAH